MTREKIIKKITKRLRQLYKLSQDWFSKLASVFCYSIIKLGTSGITNPTIVTMQKITKASRLSAEVYQLVL